MENVKKKLRVGRPVGAKQKKPLKDWEKATITLSPVARSFLKKLKLENGDKMSHIINSLVLDYKDKVEE